MITRRFAMSIGIGAIGFAMSTITGMVIAILLTAAIATGIITFLER
jgi:hypothetical protein